MGEKIAVSVEKFFNDAENIHALEILKSFGLSITNPDYKKADKEARLFEGLTFVVTGTMPRPRKEVEELIEKMGGHPTGSVSKKTDYLVLGESPGSKLKKAQTLDINIISYEDLLEMIESKGTG
jgi:DNA ligase (NAD+)